MWLGNRFYGVKPQKSLATKSFNSRYYLIPSNNLIARQKIWFWNSRKTCFSEFVFLNFLMIGVPSYMAANNFKAIGPRWPSWPGSALLGLRTSHANAQLGDVAIHLCSGPASACFMHCPDKVPRNTDTWTWSVKRTPFCMYSLGLPAPLYCSIFICVN